MTKPLTRLLPLTIALLGLSAPAAAQARLKALIPDIARIMTGQVWEEYNREDDRQITYSFYTNTVPKDSVPASLQSRLRDTALADMQGSTESDHYFSKKDGQKMETFIVQNDSIDWNVQVELGDSFYFLFLGTLQCQSPQLNISKALDKYLNSRYGRFSTTTEKTQAVKFFENGNSVLTPVRKTTWSIPAQAAGDVESDARQWLHDHALTTDYARLSLLENHHVEVAYDRHVSDNIYYFMPQADGSYDITKQEVIGKTQPREAQPIPANKQKDGIVLCADGEYYNVFNLPIAQQPLPQGTDIAFTLERRSDMTVMHIRKRINGEMEETWTDDEQTYLVDEETQVHYKARGCRPSQIWGKMIRICQRMNKTISVDIYFPPLPTGVKRFSVWGLRRFGIPSEKMFQMKSDGELYQWREY